MEDVRPFFDLLRRGAFCGIESPIYFLHGVDITLRGVDITQHSVGITLRGADITLRGTYITLHDVDITQHSVGENSIMRLFGYLFSCS